MFPLTLASGRVVELQYIMDATLLECMLVARACPFTIIERHWSGTNIYKGHAVSFLQDFNSLFGYVTIPRQAEMTP